MTYSPRAHTLFDTGASRSFISVLFASMHGLEYVVGFHFKRRGTFGPELRVVICCGLVRIKIDRQRFLAGLILIPMERFDVMLGMDGLSRYWAKIDCSRQQVTLITKRSSGISSRSACHSSKSNLEVFYWG